MLLLLFPFASLRNWSRETGSAVPPRVIPLILHIRAESDPDLRDSPAFRDGIHVFIMPSTVIDLVEPQFDRPRNYCVSRAFTAEKFE